MRETSTNLMDHVQDPNNRRRMADPNRVGYAGLGGGAAVVVYLRIKQDTVVEATYECHGCGYTIACGSVLTELLEGLSVDACTTITAKSITDILGEFPPNKQHCPALVIAALGEALNSASEGGTLAADQSDDH